MMKLRLKFILTFLFSVVLLPPSMVSAAANNDIVSTKKERNLITQGNQLYNEGKYKDAVKIYKSALEENPGSAAARYNLGLSEIRVGSNPNDTTESAKKMLESGCKNMEQVANMGAKRPDLASKANYNLGNVAFNSEDYQKAINYYKQSLRLDPDDNNARRNLRIAQLRLQNQDQDQNQDQQNQDQDQQDQEQEQNQDQDQNEDQNQDQDQDQNEDQQDQEQQQQPDINQQTAEQILNAMENKENQTRARVAGQNADKSRQRNRNRKNW